MDNSVGKEVSMVTTLHKKTVRDYIGRMQDDKINCMKVAKKYGQEYWDGDRKYGYGGYKYMEGRWAPVAQMLIDKYRLTNDSKILDVGCGKAFLLFEIKKILPGIHAVGMDISEYAKENAKEEMRSSIIIHKAQDHYPFKDKEFDLVISITTLHNLHLPDLKNALHEMTRVSKQQYLCVEAYRNEAELFNLECWALTCAAFFTPEEWVFLFKQFGYGGDYEFIYFE